MRKFLRESGGAVKAYFIFNYAERRGIIVLTILIMGIEGANLLLPSFIHSEDLDFSEFEQELLLFTASLDIRDTTHSTVKENKASDKRDFQDKYQKYEKAPPRPPVIIEINTADSAQLLALPGIGPSFAMRIMKYRGLLGGYFSREQLLEVYGMDSTRFVMFESQVIVDTGNLSKLGINHATFKELLKHPYLDYETVRDIVNYRQYVSPIKHPDTLRRIIGYEPMFNKIKHYIDYESLNPD